MTDKHTRSGDPNRLAKSIIDKVTGQQPSPINNPAVALGREDGLMGELAHAISLTPEQPAEVTSKNSAEVPNMPQRTVMQCLSLDDWKVVAHLPVPVGKLMLIRILDYGWVESRGEKQRKAIRLTPA